MAQFTADVRAFLAEPRIARLASLDEDGTPHVVPLWFDVDGDDLIVISDRRTRKVRNVSANARGAVQVGGDPALQDGAGYLFQGAIAVEEDADHAWLGRMVRRYETPEAAARLIEEWKDDDTVVLRLRVEKLVKVW